jgi:hypothetical protein
MQQAERQEEKHSITITVNDVPTPFTKGKYSVADLKTRWSIPADYQLDRFEDGEFKELTGDEVHVKNGDIFLGHVRKGGSS